MTREEKARQKELKDELIGFVTEYVNHGRYGWYLTDAGKALVATGDPRRALVAPEELEKHKAQAEAYRRAQEAMESDAVEEEILCR
jgi:hypothetical protein